MYVKQVKDLTVLSTDTTAIDYSSTGNNHNIAATHADDSNKEVSTNNGR